MIKGIQMRLMQICVIAIVMMPASHWAVADTQASCATKAENFANTNVKNVNLWLARYRDAYARCLDRHEHTYVPISEERTFDGIAADEISTKTTPHKPGNPKAVFRSPVLKHIVKPTQKPMEIYKIGQKPPASTAKRKNLSRSKKTIKTSTVLAKRPVQLFPTSDGVQKTKAVRSIGAEGWRTNCSPRFGGWDKVSDWYVSTNGKRVSCAIRP